MTPRPSYIVRRLRELTPRMVLSKVGKHASARRRDHTAREADAAQPTYATGTVASPLARLLELPTQAAGMDWLEPVCEHYVGHRFDVLGSGWTRVEYGMRCRGLEGVSFEAASTPTIDSAGAWLEGRVTSANVSESRRIWSLVSDGYTPIDWQLDIRSGYRWSAATWYRDIAVAPERGADIKIPWELARCHHLPQTALLAGWSDGDARDRLAREFRDQILDFVATNPPRFGVNWACAMDVGIRVVNWLVAYDLFRAEGVEFDSEFDGVLTRSVLEHGRHIRANLEGDDEFRGNHFLADLVGLLVCAAYLSRSEETVEWWSFASQEVLAAIEAQFLEDGANFEGSTGYHRLSAEMAVWAVALIVRRDGVAAVPPGVVTRLERMAEFVRDTSMASGLDPQIGDDDSGRLLKLGPRYHWTTLGEAVGRFANLEGLEGDAASRYWLEEQRDHRHVMAAVAGLVERDDLAVRAGEWIDRQLVTSLAGKRLASTAGPDIATRVRVGDDAMWGRCVAEAASAASRAARQEFALGTGGSRAPACVGYPDFGLYIFRHPTLFLAVRCGPVGQGGLGGHAHNDQLGVVLEIDGHVAITDPGSYLYTPLPEKRNEYRSVRAHNAPRIAGREPAALDFDLFRLDDSRARCVYFGERGFVGYHDGYGARVWRLIELGDGVVTVTDWCEDPGVAMDVPDVATAPPLSPAYGWRERGDETR